MSFPRPLCVCTEVASCRSSCLLEAGEAPFLPGVHGIVQQLLLKLMGEISVNYGFWNGKGERCCKNRLPFLYVASTPFPIFSLLLASTSM